MAGVYGTAPAAKSRPRHSLITPRSRPLRQAMQSHCTDEQVEAAEVKLPRVLGRAAGGPRALERWAL